MRQWSPTELYRCVVRHLESINFEIRRKHVIHTRGQSWAVNVELSLMVEFSDNFFELPLNTVMWPEKSKKVFSIKIIVQSELNFRSNKKNLLTKLGLIWYKAKNIRHLMGLTVNGLLVKLANHYRPSRSVMVSKLDQQTRSRKAWPAVPAWPAVTGQEKKTLLERQLETLNGYSIFEKKKTSVQRDE